MWCGWACPQTVYMEFLFRPIERLFEGGRARRRRRSTAARSTRAACSSTRCTSCSLFLAHTFLAYFVGVTALAHWVRRSPFEHPVPFVVMAGTTALIMLDFAVSASRPAWWRARTAACSRCCSTGTR